MRHDFGFYEGPRLLYGTHQVYGERKFLGDGEGYASAVGDKMAMHTVLGTVSPGAIRIV